MPERRLRGGKEPGILASSAQRAGTGGANAARMHVPQALAEAGQAIQGPIPGGGRQVTAGQQAFGQADGLAQTVEYGELAMAQLADDHVKTVGTEVYGGDDLGLCIRR
jgi:hypothetical protein